jgi:two-component system response regulator HydG
MDRLLKHPWPGNVRELENAVERAVILMIGEYVDTQDFPATLNGKDVAINVSEYTPPTMTLNEIEHRAIVNALKTANGNKSEAARRLGITRKTLNAKIQRSEE